MIHDMRSKELIYKVRRNLWDRGYAVKDMSDTTLGFHLLVEGKYRVFVTKRGSAIVEDANARDVIALVSFDAAQRVVIQYTGGNVDGLTIHPHEVFNTPRRSWNHGKEIKGQKASKKVSIVARTQYGVRGKAIDYTA